MTLPFLYQFQNRYAPVRTNGLRFHGYPGRSQAVRLIGIHTTESAFDVIGADTGAEGVARYQSTTDRPSSYHRIVDRDSTVICLPDEATAFGIGNLNSPTLHLSFALRAVDWSDPARAAAARPMLDRAVTVAAEWSRAYAIPLVWLTREQAFGTARGFIRHGVADPGRRSDPGQDFPGALFLRLVADRLTGPASTPTIPTDPEDTVTFIFNDGDKTYLRDGGDTIHVPTREDVDALLTLGVKDGRKFTAEFTARLVAAARQ